MLQASYCARCKTARLNRKRSKTQRRLPNAGCCQIYLALKLCFLPISPIALFSLSYAVIGTLTTEALGQLLEAREGSEVKGSKGFGPPDRQEFAQLSFLHTQNKPTPLVSRLFQSYQFDRPSNFHKKYDRTQSKFAVYE